MPLAQLKDQQTFEEECLQKGGICLIAVLDPSHKQHAAHLGTLRSISVMRAGQPFHPSWVDAGQHLGFVRGLGASASDVPALVVFSPKKQRAAIMRTPFERDSIQKFIDGVLGASISTAPLQVSAQQVRSECAAGMVPDVKVAEPRRLPPAGPTYVCPSP
jgi:hypothetical protein